MKYYVRTTGERKLDSSFAQIEYSVLLDKEKKITQIFGDQFLSIADEDCVLLEDDIVLCRDFKNRIEVVISEYPTSIINFFTGSVMPTKPEFSTYFSYNQCTYYPAAMLKFLGTEIYKNQHEKGLLETPEKAIQRVFKEYNLICYNYKPCLVQHLDYDSIIGHDQAVNLRRSLYFIDYLDDLGLTLEDTQVFSNKLKLIGYMQEWFKKREKEGGLVI